MKVVESTSETDYRYYSIVYPNKLFATVITAIEGVVNGNYPLWLYPADKSKFLIGIGANYLGNGFLNIISIGF